VKTLELLMLSPPAPDRQTNVHCNRSYLYAVAAGAGARDTTHARAHRHVANTHTTHND